MSTARTEVLLVATSFSIFTLIYKVHRQIQPQKNSEWTIRLLTMSHAAIVTSLSYYSCFIKGPWPLTEPGLDTNLLELTIMSFSLGYFIFDFLWCLLYGAEGLLMHIHHWFSVIYLFWGLYSLKSGSEIVGTIFGSEITNPMLQLRWMLKQSGDYNTRIGVLNDLAFITTFLSMRCGVGAYFLYCVISHPRPCIIIKGGGVCLYVISCIFGYQMICFASHKYVKRRKDANQICNHNSVSPENNNGRKDAIQRKSKTK